MNTNTVDIKLEKNSWWRKLYTRLKYYKELKDLHLSILDVSNLIRVNYLFTNVNMIDAGNSKSITHISYLLAEKYYDSIEELILKTAINNDLKKLYLPSQYLKIRLLIDKYQTGGLNINVLNEELRRLNGGALKLLFRLV